MSTFDEQADYTVIPQKPYSSFKDIGFVEEMNGRYRRTMEDGHCMIDGFRGLPHEGFFAVYDGHGGREAVEHVQKQFHLTFKNAVNEKATVQDAFVVAYKSIDEELKVKQILYNGTTAITCYIRLEQFGDRTIKKLYTANCGDARVVLNTGGRAQRLTYDHKASDPKEAKRIQDTGGFVAYNRVNGILSVTRALGDHAMKEWVVCDPFYSEVSITDKEKFLILACDGIWDVISDQESVDLIKDETTAQAMSEKLLKTALQRGSTDNISAMVLIF